MKTDEFASLVVEQQADVVSSITHGWSDGWPTFDINNPCETCEQSAAEVTATVCGSAEWEFVRVHRKT
jgi:hypothetical protein